VYFCTLYYCVLSLNTGGSASTRRTKQGVGGKCLEGAEHWIRSYKKDVEPLLDLTGAMHRYSREKVLICTQKRELESPL
jgi:hypothetical protein